jgi:hypothetical protein
MGRVIMKKVYGIDQFVYLYLMMIIALIFLSCSVSPGRSSSGHENHYTMSYTASSITNSLGTNDSTVSRFTLNDEPATYFSNFIVTNSASYPFQVVSISNTFSNNIMICSSTNNCYFTNYSQAVTNFIDLIPVSFSLYSSVTNCTTNLISSFHFSENYSNFTVSNYTVSNIVTNITCAETNLIMIYLSMDTTRRITAFALTNYYPVTGGVNISFTMSNPAYQAITFSSYNVSVVIGQSVILSSSNPNVTGLTGWKWYVDNVQELSQTGPVFTWDSTGKQPGQYIVNVDVINNGVDYSGSLIITADF